MRKHHPDFVFVHKDINDSVVESGGADINCAVEIELTLKAKENLERNIRDNYLNYDHQIWITGDNKIFNLIQAFADEYANIEVIHMDKMEELV